MSRLRILLAAALVAACSGSTSEVQPDNLASSGLSLSTDKTTYLVSDLAPGSIGIRATLTAATDKPYYARLGDAFNGASDQNPLYAAEGSDGVIERQTGGAWIKASSAILTEGVREVVINPAKSYTLLANLSPPIQTGTYRLTVLLREVSGGATTGAVHSAVFEVR